MSSNISPLFLDDEQNWPAELTRILDDGLPTLHAFFAEERQFDRLAIEDVMLRMKRPHNTHRSEKEKIYQAAGQLLAGRSVVGWHCTRLCDDEIAILLREGMYPLSIETFTARLERRIEAGDIPKSLAMAYGSRNQAALPNRQMLWFIFTRNLLRDEDGVGRLLTSWGGEALYNSHERDEQTGPMLRSIGRPCIVEAEMPIEIVEAYSASVEWVVRPYLHRRHINDGHSPERDGYIRQPLDSERIRRIISLGEPNFEELTGASMWRRYPLAAR